MDQFQSRPVRGINHLVSVFTLVLAVAGLLAQAGFMLREASDELTASRPHTLRAFLTEADRVIPPGDSYAIPSDVRADNARYVLYPRQRIDVPAFTRDALRKAGVRWVIVTNDVRPPALRGSNDWFRAVVRSPAGRLLEVTP